MSRIHNTANKYRRTTKIIFLHATQFCHETHALDSYPDDLICMLSWMCFSIEDKRSDSSGVHPFMPQRFESAVSPADHLPLTAGWRIGLTPSIEWFIEDQAFSPSYDLAPPPPRPLPPSSFSNLDRRHTGGLERESTCSWEGVEPNHKTARKPGPL